jgi:hypothetical protein
LTCPKFRGWKILTQFPNTSQQLISTRWVECTLADMSTWSFALMNSWDVLRIQHMLV